jgi:hypothetical protein
MIDAPVISTRSRRPNRRDCPRSQTTMVSATPAIAQRRATYTRGWNPCVTPYRTAVKLKLHSNTVPTRRLSEGSRRTRASIRTGVSITGW